MSRVVLNERGIKHLFSGKGAVGRIIDGKARLIHDHAKSNIQTRLVARSGDLEANLRMIKIDSADGYHVVVGTDAKHRGFAYARALETGINPETGEEMGFHESKAFMVPAVIQSGFRLRRA